MPKITFHNEGNFRKWLEVVAKKKYALYLVLKRNQLIAEPQTSTQPVRFAIYINSNISVIEFEKLSNQIAVEYNLPLIVTTDYEFSDTQKI